MFYWKTISDKEIISKLHVLSLEYRYMEYLKGSYVKYQDDLINMCDVLRDKQLGTGHYRQDGIYLKINKNNFVLPAFYDSRKALRALNGYYIGVPLNIVEIYNDANSSTQLDLKMKLYQSCGVERICNIFLNVGFVDIISSKEKRYKLETCAISDFNKEMLKN